MAARSDELLNRPDKNDLSDCDGLVRRALQAKRTIETGFLELADISERARGRIKTVFVDLSV